MKKTIIVLIALVIGFVLCAHWLTYLIASEVGKEKNKYKSRIGQKIVFEKDTLTIVDYSSIMETFTLSNGVNVNASMVFNKDSVSAN